MIFSPRKNPCRRKVACVVRPAVAFWLVLLVLASGRAQPAFREDTTLLRLLRREHLSSPLPPVEATRAARAESLWALELEPWRKTSGFTGMFSREDVQRARRTVRNHAWARKELRLIRQDADFWARFSDAFLYALLPTQNPRALTPSQYHGCPIHGGNRTTLETSLEHPYRYRCRVGGEWWYDGARVVNPTTGDTVVVHDDGSGWVAPEGFANPGERYYFKGAYRLYLILKLFSHPYGPEIHDTYRGLPPVQALAFAYALTGQSRYAHKAGVLLNRIAQLYPHFDGLKEGYAAYDRWKAPIRGYVGEASGREQGFLNSVALVYDLIFDAFSRDDSLAAFFAARGFPDLDGDGRVTPADLTLNVEHNLFGFALEFIDRTIPIAPGDFLMSTHSSLIHMAGCLPSPKLRQRLFEGPNNLPLLMSNSFFRDGKWWYDSIGYSLHNSEHIAELAEWLNRFDLYASEGPVRQIVSFPLRVDCDGRLPPIGDTVNPRTEVRVRPHRLIYRVAEVRLLGEHECENLRPGRDPAALWSLFHQCQVDTSRPARVGWGRKSELFHDSGFAILRSGEGPADRVHVVLDFDKGTQAHGHRDKLAVNVLAYGYDLTADVGYPASWIARKLEGWETHSLSHATVLIDGKNQALATGSLVGFFPGGRVQVVEAEAETAYPGLARVYRRGLMLVRVDSQHVYVVDVFRVAGGSTYDYSFHSYGTDGGKGLEVAAAEDTLVWHKQARGTLAGEEVKFGDVPGYGWLKDVRRAQTSRGFTATWRKEGTRVGLQLHMLADDGTTLFVARGEGNGVEGMSPWDPYLVVRRRDSGGRGRTFVAVIEPFRGEPFVSSVRLLAGDRAAGANAVLALEITLRNGARQRVFVGPESESRVESERGDFAFQGRWGWLDVGSDEAFLADGQLLRHGNVRLTLPPQPGGRVLALDVDRGELILQDTSSVSASALTGRTIVLSRPGQLCRSSYTVARAERSGSVLRVRVSPSNLVLSRGRVSGVQGSTVTTKTPLAKLENVPGLFDAKLVRDPDAGVAARLVTAVPGKLTFASEGVASAFRPGDRFEVLDVGPGDGWRIPLSVTNR